MLEGNILAVKVYLDSVLICLLFWICHEFTVVRNKKMMYAVWGGFEIILIVCFIRNIPQSMENNISIIVLQMALLIFVLSFNRNINKKKIYEIIYNSPFSIGMCTGLNQLSEDEYGMLERKLKYMEEV